MNTEIETYISLKLRDKYKDTILRLNNFLEGRNFIVIISDIFDTFKDKKKHEETFVNMCDLAEKITPTMYNMTHMAPEVFVAEEQITRKQLWGTLIIYLDKIDDTLTKEEKDEISKLKELLEQRD